MDDDTGLITTEDRYHGPIDAVLINPGGRIVRLTLKKAPMRFTYRYGSVEADYEVTGLDERGRFVYAVVGAMRRV